MAHMRAVEAMLFALLEPKNSLPESNIPPRWSKKKDIKSIWFELVLVTSVILHKRACMQKHDPEILSFPSQGSQHDEDCCRAPLWTDGGWVSNKRGADSSTAHDTVGDAEASQNKLSPGSAGEVQEFLPDGQQKRRGGTLWCSPSGYSLLWAAERLLLRATSWTRHVLKPHNQQTSEMAFWVLLNFFFLWTFWRLMISLKN